MKRLTDNPLFVFIIAAFAIWIIGQTDAMASFTDAIYAALNDSFDVLPLVAVLGAIALIGGYKYKTR